MKQITAIELPEIKTFITAFMLDRTLYFKNYGQLLEIFELSYERMISDPSKDLRILEFADDMENQKWNSDIVITCQRGLANDGIHRGIAYLRCIKKGISEENLPKIFIDDLN